MKFTFKLPAVNFDGTRKTSSSEEAYQFSTAEAVEITYDLGTEEVLEIVKSYPGVIAGITEMVKTVADNDRLRHKVEDLKEKLRNS